MSCLRPRRIAALSLLLLAVAAAGCRSKTSSRAREFRPTGAPAMLIDLPPEYNIERRPGADFEIFYFQRARTEHGDPPRDGMGIYFGHSPSFAPPKDARTISGTVAGRKVTWYAWEDDSGDRALLRVQTLINDLLPDQKDKAGATASPQVHIFLWAPGQKRLGILRDAAESLRLK